MFWVTCPYKFVEQLGKQAESRGIKPTETFIEPKVILINFRITRASNGDNNSEYTPKCIFFTLSPESNSRAIVTIDFDSRSQPPVVR